MWADRSNDEVICSLNCASHRPFEWTNAPDQEKGTPVQNRSIIKARLRQTPLARLSRALHRRGEEGMAILEYAIGILVVAGFGFLVFKLIQSDSFFEFLVQFSGQVFKIITTMWPF
jgi:hypothetical protein